jgi:hypothetical protein
MLAASQPSEPHNIVSTPMSSMSLALIGSNWNIHAVQRIGEPAGADLAKRRA